MPHLNESEHGGGLIRPLLMARSRAQIHGSAIRRDHHARRRRAPRSRSAPPSIAPGVKGRRLPTAQQERVNCCAWLMRTCTEGERSLVPIGLRRLAAKQQMEEPIRLPTVTAHLQEDHLASCDEGGQHLGWLRHALGQHVTGRRANGPCPEPTLHELARRPLTQANLQRGPPPTEAVSEGSTGM